LLYEILSEKKGYDGEKLFAYDKKLFNDVASLDIIHAIARCWAREHDSARGSYALPIVFHVLRYHINEPESVAPVMMRILEIAYDYSLEPWERMKRVAPFAKDLFALMFYNDVKLLTKGSDGLYKIVTDGIKRDRGVGFIDVVRASLFPDVGLDSMQYLIKAQDVVIDAADSALQNEEMFHMMPKSLLKCTVQSTIYEFVDCSI
jgi:hypothetical protein